MEAPDKIYVAADSEFGFKNTKTAIAFSFEQKFDTAEYIRKDALLASLNERRKGLTSGDSFVAGERKMLKEIIDKLSSM